MSAGSAGLENIYQAMMEDQLDSDTKSQLWQTVVDIRMPRTLGAWTAGALLGLAGAVAQGLFRNPLADPHLLGSASGASLGVALVMAAAGGGAGVLAGGIVNVDLIQGLTASKLWVRLGLTGAAFLGAVGAVCLTLLLARGTGHTTRLLMAGVMVSLILGSATSLLLLVSPDVLQSMQSFMLGSTAFLGWMGWSLTCAVWLVCFAATWSLSRALDGMSLGERTAESLGLPMSQIRVVLIGVLGLATGTAVAQTGVIAFVGLASPHLVRAIVKVTHRQIIWLASLMGGSLLCVADLLSRCLISPQELPIGVLTAALGGSYLLWLMNSQSSTLNAAH